MDIKKKPFFYKIKYKLFYWKLGVHLIFQTKKFGVNNYWISKYPSIFGIGFLARVVKILLVYPIMKNYKNVSWRMGYSMGFITESEYFHFFL